MLDTYFISHAVASSSHTLMIAHAVASSSHTLRSLWPASGPKGQGPLASASPASAVPSGGTDVAPTALKTFLADIAVTLRTVGGVLCVIGLIVGGIMRATAFGSERRIATSNLALSCAVLGLLIILLAEPIADAIIGIFPS